MIKLIVIIVASDPKLWTKLEWAVFCAGGFVISLWLIVFWRDPAAKLPWH